VVTTYITLEFRNVDLSAEYLGYTVHISLQ